MHSKPPAQFSARSRINLGQLFLTRKSQSPIRIRTTTSADDGSYRVPALRSGHYTVKTEAQGFEAEATTSLTLDVAQELVVNPKLQVGATVQVVTVTEEAPLINTTNSAISTTVNEQQMAELPINGRNFIDLTF